MSLTHPPDLVFIFTLSLTHFPSYSYFHSLTYSFPPSYFYSSLSHSLTSPSYCPASLSHFLTSRLTLHFHSLASSLPVLLFIFTLSLTHFPRLSIPASRSVIPLQPAAYHTTGHVPQLLSLPGPRLVLSCLVLNVVLTVDWEPGTPSARSN